MQKGFVFDLNKCTGCNACQIACSIENEVELPRNWRQVNTFNEPKHPEIPYFHLSTACHHCIDPSCMKYCPALAIYKDQNTGAVLIEEDKCIGCHYCSWVCPYDAPIFNIEKQTMEKCTFCSHRLVENLLPACVSLCPTNALQIADHQEDFLQEQIPGFTKTELKPAIQLIPLREDQQLPEISELPFDDKTLTTFRNSLEKNNIREKIHCLPEWPLVLFSVLLAFITGSYTAQLLVPAGFPKTGYVFLAIIGIGISGMHLGKKFRAHRAILNLRNSWLSREILFYILFLAFLSGQIIFFPNLVWLSWIVVLVGFLTLFAIDHVYTVIATAQKQLYHSAYVLLTGLFLASLILEFMFGIVMFGGIKLILYLGQFYHRFVQGNGKFILFGSIRVLFGFIIPAIFWFWDITGAFTFCLILILIAELIDRCEFYENLKTISPAKQMVMDLKKIINHKEHQE